MAEAAVGPIIQRLGSLLMEEVKLLGGVHKGIANIKAELESIQSFLRDAAAKVDQDYAGDSMKTWVKQVRDVAFQIEDVIDEYMLHVAPCPGQRRCSLLKIIRLVKKLKARRQIASEIGDLKNSVREINRRGNEYGLTRIEHSTAGQSTWHDPRVTSLFVKEAELVGIEASINELVKNLVEGPSENTVISLVGMGGIGKSTLAKKAVEHQRLMGHFQCSAWITVSQSYSREQLLKSMITEFRSAAKEPNLEGIDSMKEEVLMKKSLEYLSGKRYAVVFDDVWDIDFWGYMKCALPDNDKGNRIIITTRNENVAPSPKESPFYHVRKVQPLSNDDALELFCKKVFQFQGGHCPQELLELSSAIVERCDGLPLAIGVIGGLLATKEKNVSEWQNFYDSLVSELASNQRFSSITRILTLSYQDLPFHLKSCFLYFGVCPEDRLISPSKLIRLWMAEGFISRRREKTPEKVGEEYLTELIQRSLVQVVQFYIGRAKRCKVHDLMYDVICSRSEELGLHRVSVENDRIIEGIGRRLSIQDKSNNDNIFGSSTNVKSRSMVFFCVKELPNSLSIAIFTRFKLLKVLDFEGAPLSNIPKELGGLFYLSYLSLKDTKVGMLPKSIGKLQNLETLDLRECPLHILKIKTNSFLKLRYLVAHCYNVGIGYNTSALRGLKIQGRIGCLNALQKLRDIEVDDDEELIRDLESLTQLRTLGIWRLKEEHGSLLCTALQKMIHLYSLDVSSSNEAEFLNLQSIAHPPPLLEHLYLNGPLKEMPHWISKLKNLTKIKLIFSRLEVDPLQMLQLLPNLQDMQLSKAYNGNQLHFEKGYFKKLKTLLLSKLDGLKTLTIGEGALSSLEEFGLLRLPQLKEVPSGIHHLRNLKFLGFGDAQRELVYGLFNDNWKVSHVPTVNFKFSSREGAGPVIYRLGDEGLLEYLRNGDQSTSTTSP